MPRKYVRKLGTTPRRQWSTANLKEAIHRLNNGVIGLREASRYYGIPTRTLKRRWEADDVREKSLGPSGVFDKENEKKLVAHILELSKAGFAPDMRIVRSIAYQFAVELKLPHKFNAEEKLAGYDWFYSFIERNPNLSIRKAEGLSLVHAQTMNRDDISKYFDMLEKIVVEHGLADKPQNIFNMDETCLAINTEPGKVIGEEGAEVVQNIPPWKKEEHVTIVGACSAEGRFLPPVLILKGLYKQDDWMQGLPPASDIFMNPKNSCMTTDLFSKWFVEIFLPRKAPGINLLILDGHASHCSSPELLQLAKDNSVVMLILPRHTTAVLQPLDRCIYGPFKTVVKRDANFYLTLSKRENMSMVDIGKLIGGAWNTIASVANGVSAFKSTGIYPLNPHAILDQVFPVSDSVVSAQQQSDFTSTNQPSTSNVSMPAFPDAPQPSTSKESTPDTPDKCHESLSKISPIPHISSSEPEGEQQASILTSSDFISEKRKKRTTKGMRKQKKPQRSVKASEDDFVNLCIPLDKDGNAPKNNSEIEKIADSYRCAECWENCFVTSRKDDWIKCIFCGKWLHENCTVYGTKCTDCGRNEIRKMHLQTKSRFYNV